MTRKVSKFESETRADLEESIVKRGNSKPEPWFPMNERELAIFHNLASLNDYYADADGIPLSMLAISLSRYELFCQVSMGLDIEDERVIKLEKRKKIVEQSIIQNMNMLCIPLSQRLRLSNDLAKLRLEEKKLQEMDEQELQPENPLLALLK
ncbi:hypothetical protein ABER68_05020 [Paenibacillus alvei]